MDYSIKQGQKVPYQLSEESIEIEKTSKFIEVTTKVGFNFEMGDTLIKNTKNEYVANEAITQETMTNLNI